MLFASGLGLVHESINVNQVHDYTSKLSGIRMSDTNADVSASGSWFACKSISGKVFTCQTLLIEIGANSVFAQTILDLAKRKPHLIFGAGTEPYIVE